MSHFIRSTQIFINNQMVVNALLLRLSIYSILNSPEQRHQSSGLLALAAASNLVPEVQGVSDCLDMHFYEVYTDLHVWKVCTFGSA